MNFAHRREQLFAQMADHSALILYSGTAPHRNSDAYYDLEVDHHFFYLTGLRREDMILLMTKTGSQNQTTLYIPKIDPTAERWTGKMVTQQEAREITGIQDVRELDRFEDVLNYTLHYANITTCYFNCYRNDPKDLPDYNLAKAQAFAAAHPGIAVRDLWPMVSLMRMQKDADEVECTRRAIDITDKSLQYMLRHLQPGQKEYQAQANYEYMLHYLGAEGPSFPTIAGSGKNGTMLHYETNRDTCADGSLLLLDLGVRLDGYCSDITRTYPVNGKYSPRQRQVYDIVLRANREVAAQAKPGLTTRQLNDICRKVLAEGCIELGLIEKEEEIDRYYMHGVSHHLGIDVHDVNLAGLPLKPGAIISDEPGLYIDEWEIGIRIEDDLLITESGCEVLSQQIMREADEIEAFMAETK